MLSRELALWSFWQCSQWFRDLCSSSSNNIFLWIFRRRRERWQSECNFLTFCSDYCFVELFPPSHHCSSKVSLHLAMPSLEFLGHTKHIWTWFPSHRIGYDSYLQLVWELMWTWRHCEHYHYKMVVRCFLLSLAWAWNKLCFLLNVCVILAFQRQPHINIWLPTVTWASLLSISLV